MPDDHDQDGLSMELNCPMPIGVHKEIQIGHGGGGRLTQQLLDEIFLPAFANNALGAAHDGAIIEPTSGPLAFSTDSHVVRPIEFPGGNIGSLAIHGTANDLAMCAARPQWMSVGFILEEGLPIETLKRMVDSMRAAADDLGIRVVTGDTKVVERGKGDRMYVNTSGIGKVLSPHPVGPASIREGDVILLSGDIGRHGMAIMAHREGLEFETTIKSDSAHLWPTVRAFLSEGIELHCLRDLTRGGLAAALLELAASAKKGFLVNERAIAVSEGVRGACELLGLDPMHVANEGRLVAIVPEAHADVALQTLRGFAPGGRHAAIIGHVDGADPGTVRLRSLIGVERILDRPSGEQLPRIC
jgi:hydrogenase expression/formation protein HypE